MKRNPHFETYPNWKVAAQHVAFAPRRPAYTAGFKLASLAVHVMDHKKRRLPVGSRSLEAQYGGFVIDQKQASSVNQAARMALATPYGAVAQAIEVAGHPGRSYPPGEEPGPGDTDGRPPAVVAWHDGALFYLIASTRLDEEKLIRIATSMYPARK